MKRRELLQTSALAALGAWSAVGSTAWAYASSAEAGDGAGGWGSDKRFVMLMLRGAVDGLSLVVPYADTHYYQWRSSIAIAPPGNSNGVLDLDGRFGLHPALGSLMPLWQAKQLAFVHACGSPDPTRSHFDAQDYMESATPGRKATPDGWMNRLIGVLPDAKQGHAATRAVNIGAVLPRIYAGPQTVADIPAGVAASRPTLLDKPRIGNAFAQMYGGKDKLSQAYQESMQAHHEVMDALNLNDPAQLAREMQAANNGAPLPNGFPADAARLATLMRNDSRVQLAFMALGGWDTHANQGNGTGQLASHLAPLGKGLAALAEGLGPVWKNTVVVVMSEFGRTVKQNGNGGTDHGHGNVAWVLGGGVRGGKVYGRWPGLDESALYQGRDLAVNTDFRQVLAEVASGHLGVADAQMPTLLPGYAWRQQPALHFLNA